MRRHILRGLVLCCIVAAVSDIGASQTSFRFDPELKARLARMIRRDPGACVELIEESESLEELRQSLVERVRTKYRAVKVVEAVRALRDLDLPEDMTLRELRETAEAIEMERDGR